MEEQARVLFKSTENTASNAPKNMVKSPRIKSSMPQGLSWRKILQLTTKIPKTPDFVRIPDNSADAGAGATG